MYKLVLNGTKLYNSVDECMIETFKSWPNAHFSDWQETINETWLNIYNNSIFVGKIFEVN
ncbi:MAG: hypothetical protein WC929_04865 [Bacilli bacterium]|jgi:hypothetical protein